MTAVQESDPAVATMAGVDWIDRAHTDPERALATADAALADGSAILERATWHRVRAVALRVLGDLDSSTAAAETAVSAAVRDHDRRAEALARATLASTLLQRGDLDRSIDELTAARATVTGPDALEIGGILGVALGRSGRLADGRAALEVVIAGADAAGRPDLAADAHANAGLLAGFARDLDAAERHLHAARDRLFDAGDTAGAAQMTHNLGWVAARRGALADAFRHYDDATAVLTGNDYWDDAVHAIDRAEALATAGIFAEATERAAAAAEVFAAHGAGTDAAEAWLVAAQAAVAGGDETMAADLARRAGRAFSEQGREGWRIESELVAIDAALTGRVEDATDLRQRADEVVAALSGSPSLHVRVRAAITAIRCAIAAGDLATATRRLEACAAADRSTALLADLAVIELAHAGGTPVDAVRIGLGRLRTSLAERAVIASPDVRAGVGAWHAELRRRTVAAATEVGDATTIHEVGEHGGLAVLEPPPLVPLAESDLATVLVELRELGAERLDRERDLEPTADISDHIDRLECTAADLGRTARPVERGGLPAGSIDVPTLLGHLDDTTLVTIAGAAALGGSERLVAAVTDRRGSSVIELGERCVVDHASAALVAALDRCLRRSRSDRAATAAERELERASETLDDLLGRLGSFGSGPIVVVVPATLAAAPLAHLPSLRGRAFTIAPAASLMRRPRRSGGGAVAIAGPGLACSTQEAEQVVAAHGGGATLCGAQATWANLLEQAGGASVLHVAAHGRVHPSHPLLSSLELADGPAPGLALARLEPAPATVVLAACESAIPGRIIGGELLGFSSVLLAAGARHVVTAPVRLPDDQTTVELMTALHSGLAGGDGGDGGEPAAVLAELHADHRLGVLARTLVVHGC